MNLNNLQNLKHPCKSVQPAVWQKCGGRRFKGRQFMSNINRRQTYFVFSLTLLLSISSCSLFEQNDFIVSEIISNTTKEQVYYDVYQTGLDNYRFEFKSANNSDTTNLFEYFLNDAIYTAMRFTSVHTNDSLTITTNFPINKMVSKTKSGTIVILKHE